jgi:hypothetical protein
MIDPSTIMNGMSEPEREDLQKRMQEVHNRMAKAPNLVDKMRIIQSLIEDAIKAQEAYEKSKSNPVERSVAEEQSQG